MRKLGFRIAAVMAGAAAPATMAAVQAPSVIAATTPVAGTTTTFDKYLVMKRNANVPNATFSYTISAPSDPEMSALANPEDTNGTNLTVRKGIGAPTVSSTTFNAGDQTFDDVQKGRPNKTSTTYNDQQNDDVDGLDKTKKYAKKTATVDFRSVNFSEPGVYRYKITEKATSAFILYAARAGHTYTRRKFPTESPALLIANVCLHVFQAALADCRDEIAVAPEQRLPVILLQFRFSELLSRKPTRFRLYNIYKLTRRCIRIRLKKHMNMVLSAVHFQDVQSSLTEYVSDYLIYKIADFSSENRLPVFCDEHHVILQQKTAVSVCVVRLILFSSVHCIIPPLGIYPL